MANYGLQTWDKNGRLEFDVGTRILRLLGSVNTGRASGSLYDPRLTTARPFYFAAPSGTYPLRVWFSGGTMYWDYNTDRRGTYQSYWQGEDYILYGIY